MVNHASTNAAADDVLRHEITWHDYETGLTHKAGDPIVNPRTGKPYTRLRGASKKRR